MNIKSENIPDMEAVGMCVRAVMTLADCEVIRQDPRLARSLETLTNFFTWRCNDVAVATDLNEHVGEIADVAEGISPKDDNWIENYRSGVIDMYHDGLLDDFRKKKNNVQA